MTPAPPLGLLLDVDGPIASPITRRIEHDSIVEDLIRLAGRGVPIVFNTGRSDAFVRREVFAPLRRAGAGPAARIHAVCEKGAVWLSLHDEAVNVDGDLTVPAGLEVQIDELVADEYAALMFFDRTKHAMISVEQQVHASSADYLAAQPGFEERVLALMRANGLGVAYRESRFAGPDGGVPYRVDSSIISTDIESIAVGKDLGTERALALLAADGPAPLRWRTMGDSRGDYAMAHWLHGHGHDVEHVDVRPAEGVPTTPYPVLTAADLLHIGPDKGTEPTDDAVGARFLRAWADLLDPPAPPAPR